jgi:hypothetical protein
MWKPLLFILLLFSLFSCGATNDDKLKDAILDAEIALGSSNCQYAIDVLETYGRVKTNALYLKTLASAYACRAGYSTPKFFSSDLTLAASLPPLGGLSLFSTSGVTVTNPLQNDPSFIDLQTAINILLYAGGIASTTEPTVAERAKYFSSDQAGDINSQLLFMELVQMGKYLRVYGNGSATGIKGSGAASNSCFTSYSNAPGAVQAVIPAFPGACKSIASSHAQLIGSLSPATTRKTRLCHGVILLNGMFDLLPSVVGAASGGSLTSISAMTAAISGAKTALLVLDSGIGSVLTTVNQSTCEDNAVVTVPNIESYFAGMMESVFL